MAVGSMLGGGYAGAPGGMPGGMYGGMPVGPSGGNAGPGYGCVGIHPDAPAAPHSMLTWAFWLNADILLRAVLQALTRHVQRPAEHRRAWNGVRHGGDGPARRPGCKVRGGERCHVLL